MRLSSGFKESCQVPGQGTSQVAVRDQHRGGLPSAAHPPRARSGEVRGLCLPRHEARASHHGCGEPDGPQNRRCHGLRRFFEARALTSRRVRVVSFGCMSAIRLKTNIRFERRCRLQRTTSRSELHIRGDAMSLEDGRMAVGSLILAQGYDAIILKDDEMKIFLSLLALMDELDEMLEVQDFDIIAHQNLHVAERLVSCVCAVLQDLRENHGLLVFDLLLPHEGSIAQTSGTCVIPVIAIFMQVGLRQWREYKTCIDEVARKKVVLLDGY
mmetsp:Transcript_23952/g.53671  ORF Transcript_23952/g.53671 Transcript_23952/m.53671 type:complete len:270 (+) Transcript_23952:956-1765(+)